MILDEKFETPKESVPDDETTSNETKDEIVPNCPVETELRRQGITMNDLTTDNPRLSLDWQSFQGVTQCSCAAAIEYLTRKVRFPLLLFSACWLIYSITADTVTTKHCSPFLIVIQAASRSGENEYPGNEVV